MWKQTNTFCCPAGCTRINGYDNLCSTSGLGPIGRACTLGAPMPSGCSKAPVTSNGSHLAVCCPS
jgi:hypothetical protein